MARSMAARAPAVGAAIRAGRAAWRLPARENEPVTELEAAVDLLHAVPLEDFVAERKRLAKELRAAGDGAAAAELAKLPKPSAPAWALNHVAREQPQAIGDWLDAAAALRDASTHADRTTGDVLRSAMAAHRDATRRLLATVRDEARPNGRALSEPMVDRMRDLLHLGLGLLALGDVGNGTAHHVVVVKRGLKLRQIGQAVGGQHGGLQGHIIIPQLSLFLLSNHPISG